MFSITYYLQVLKLLTKNLRKRENDNGEIIENIKIGKALVVDGSIHRSPCLEDVLDHFPRGFPCSIF